MKMLLALVLCLLGAETASAQAVCRNFTFPFQGRQPNGSILRDVDFDVPEGLEGLYPVQFAYPKGATRVGLEYWSHAFYHQTIVKDTVLVVGFIDRVPDARYPHAKDNAVVVQMFHNGQDVDVALSTVLNPGETYLVGMWNFAGKPVTIKLAVTVLVCFATQGEMDAYVRATEP